MSHRNSHVLITCLIAVFTVIMSNANAQNNENEVSIEIIQKKLPTSNNALNGELKFKINSVDPETSIAVLIQGKNPQIFHNKEIALENLSSDFVTIVVHSNSSGDFIQKINMTTNE